MRIVCGDMRGKIFYLLRRIAHGHGYARCTKHGNIVAVVANGHDLLRGNLQRCGKRLQSNTLVYAAGIDFHRIVRG